MESSFHQRSTIATAVANVVITTRTAKDAVMVKARVAATAKVKDAAMAKVKAAATRTKE